MAARLSPYLTLRRMTLDDLEGVMHIERVSHRHPWSLELVRRELDHDWSTVILAMDVLTTEPVDRPEFEQIAGFIIFWLVHDEQHVLNVATDPRFRRRGVGRALMLEAEARSRRRGAVLSTLEVRRSNVGAIALYEQLGYRQVGVRPRYYQEDQEDAFVMTKDLPRD